MSISANISSAKTIRDYLDSITDKANTAIKITTGTNTTTDLYNVDLTWDGQNYYILGTATQDDTQIKIYKLDNVLPLIIG